MRLFRRYIVRCTKNRVICGQVTIFCARNTKVHDFDVAVGLNHDILRFNVAMNNIVTMCYRECLCNLGANLSNLFAVKRTVFANAAFKVGAAQVFHSNEIRVIIFSPVVHRNNKRALKCCSCLSLLLKPCGKRWIGSILG